MRVLKVKFVLLVSICTLGIQSVVGASVNDFVFSQSGAGAFNAVGNAFGATNVFADEFCSNLKKDLCNHDLFKRCFSVSFGLDVWLQIFIEIGNILHTEYRIGYSFVDKLYSRLIGLPVGPWAYAEAIESVMKEECGYLANESNSETLHTVFLNIIVRAIAKVCLNLNINLGIDLTVYLNAGLGIEVNAGLNVDLGANVNLNVGENVIANADVNVNANADIDALLDVDLNAIVDIDADVNVDTDVHADASANVDLSADVDINANVAAVIEIGGNSLCGISLAVAVNIGCKVDLSPVHKDCFKKKLIDQLLLNKPFKYVCINSGSLPTAARRTLLAAIAEYLSRAFCSLPRSAFLPLESAITLTDVGKSFTVEAYAEMVADILATILCSAKVIVTDTLELQAIIAVTAFGSGIVNYYRISKVSGIGLYFTVSQNSYFSVYNSLGKLNYVGIDASTKTSPPVIRTAKTSTSSLRFIRVLSFNLISSNKFCETFSLGVATISYKSLSISLGKYMAEAFGSINSAVFVQNFESVLCRLGGQLNYKSYARILSIATAKALETLGYFVSGIEAFQAAIAANAIIRTIIKIQRKSSCTDVVLYPAVLDLRCFIPLAGVPIPDAILQAGINFNLNLGVFSFGVNADIGVSAGVNVNADVDLSAKVDVNADVDVDLSAEVDTDVELGVFADLAASVDVDAVVDISAGVDVTAGLDVGVQARLTIIQVFPPMLANHFYKSTAIFTAISLVGSTIVRDLLAQAVAQNMGTAAAGAFLKTYQTVCDKLFDRSFASSVLPLSAATASALCAAGLLQIPMTVQELDGLAGTITEKFSALIANSPLYDPGEEQWLNLYRNDCYDPVLSACDCY